MQSQHTQNPPVASTHGDLVEVRASTPFTTTLTVAEGVGLEHKRVIELVRRYRPDFEEFGTLPFQTAKNRGSQGRPTEYAELNEDQATYLITLFRNTDIVRGFKIRLVKAFRKALNEIERLTHQRSEPQWQMIRDETKVGFKWMNETLKESREAIGKETKAHHFSNEARMINAILSGKHGKLDRDALSGADLVLMADLQRLNAVLIGQNLPYQARKEMLLQRSQKRLAA
jgi:phage regulator Rha-like protein